MYALLRLIDKLNRKHLKMYLKELETQLDLPVDDFASALLLARKIFVRFFSSPDNLTDSVGGRIIPKGGR